MQRTEMTDRQAEIYAFICSHVERFDFPPTVREIGANFGITSPNGVMCHLKALQKKGLIERLPFAARAIHLVRPQRDLLDVAVSLIQKMLHGSGHTEAEAFLDEHGWITGESTMA